MADDIVNGFVSPGYAVAGQLQQILARKAADKRQAMLDQIARQNADANTQESQARLAESQARIKDAETRANKEWADNLGPDQVLAPDEVDRVKSVFGAGSIVEKPTGKYREATELDTDTGPDDSGELQPVPLTQQVFKGSPKYLQDQMNRQKAQEILQNQDMDPVMKALMLNSLGVKVEPSDMRTSHPLIFDEVNKKWIEQGDINVYGATPHATANRPPQPQRIAPDIKFVRDKEGNVLAAYDYSSGTPKRVELPPEMSKGGAFIQDNSAPPLTGRGGSGGGSGIDPTDAVFDPVALRSFSAAKAVLANPNALNADKRKAYGAAVGGVDSLVLTAKLSPQARGLLRRSLEGYKNTLVGQPDTSPYANIGARRIAELAIGTGDLDPSEKEIFILALSGIRGK